jgi:hypothetical protein
MADLLWTGQRFRYECHTNTDAAGGHDIELPWVPAIQNESDCRAACDRLSNCSAFVVGNQTVVRGALEKCRLWRWLSGICGRLLLLPTDTCWLLVAAAACPRPTQRSDGSAHWQCGGCWLKADPLPTTNPLGPADPFGKSTCRKYCGKTSLPLYTCNASKQCVLATGGARVSYTDRGCFGQCVGSGGAFSSPAARNYSVLTGGDCCPASTNCTGGRGPYAISTGGDYPSMTSSICDDTPGCVAFGQMTAFVTHYYFHSRDACEQASQSARPIAGSFKCASPPASTPTYLSTVRVISKMPWACYTSSIVADSPVSRAFSTLAQASD